MHATVRALLIPEIVRLIAERHDWPEDEALDRFYNSATGANFADDETGLYGQSPWHIYGLFAEELKERPNR